MILRAAILGTLARDFVAGADLAAKISRWSPRPIDPEQVHVRTFLAANSRPSKDNFLRIREKAISKFAELYPGAPVMRNHDMMWGFSMPIGTVFDGVARTAEDKHRELLLPFYLARNDEMGDMAAKYIDLGIWKESSIHGLFAVAECSICKKSLDQSEKDCCTEHEPGEEYSGESALIELDKPTEAPEFSLCWSGRLAGTRALSQAMPGTLTVREFMERRSSWLARITGRPRRRPWLESILVTKAA